MEALVVTLETAKKLKAAGFPQTLWIWVQGFDGQNKLTSFQDPWYKAVTNFHCAGYEDETHPMFAAPTAQEIADQLPPQIYLHAQSNGDWVSNVYKPKEPGVGAPTEAEALALLWLKLQEAK